MLKSAAKGGFRLNSLIVALFILPAGVCLRLPNASAAEQRTAEQVFKNIQILKGMPDSQLPAVMNYMQASLGARDCEYCHVKSADGPLDFEKDDKPRKQETRKMLQMVFDLNKASFNGRPEVTCYTCHQGRERPVSLPPLNAVAAKPESPAARPAGQAPTPEQILDKYVQAVGGKAAAEKFTSAVLKGTYASADGAPLPLEVYRKAPGKVFSAVTTAQQGVMEQAFDGATGWTRNQRGTREMPAAQMERLKNQEGIYDVIKIQEPFPRMRPGPREKVGDREAFVLRAQGADNKAQRFYFDTESGLLLRKVVLTPTIIGLVPEQIDFEDYQEVDGAKLPFTIRLSLIDSRNGWTQKFTEIRRDVAIEDSKFSKPGGNE